MTIRPAVLKFAELMEARLREHDHKGGWEKDDALTLARRLKSNADTLIQMARDAGAGEGSPGIFWMTVHKLAAFRSAILADAAKDVEPVAWGIFANNGNIRFWACDKSTADLQAAKTGGDVVGIVPAPTLAAAQALNAELVARVEGLEKDAARYRWLRDGELTADYPYPVMRMGGSRVDDQTIWADELDAAIDAALTKGQP